MKIIQNESLKDHSHLCGISFINPTEGSLDNFWFHSSKSQLYNFPGVGTYQ